MLGSLRRKLGAAGLALSSLLPNPGKVSFLGTRGVQSAVRAVTAIEQAAASETGAAGTAANVASSAARTVGTRAVAGVAGAGAVVAGGEAVERACGSGAVRAVETKVVPGIVERETPALAEGWEARYSGRFVPPEEPLVGPRIQPSTIMRGAAAAGSESTTQTATRTALESTGFHIYAAGPAAEADLTTTLANHMLKRESIDLAASVLDTLSVPERQSDAAIARAFRNAFPSRGLFKYDFNAGGIVRIRYLSGSVNLVAEFNAYSVIRTAAVVGATATPLSVPHAQRNPGD